MDFSIQVIFIYIYNPVKSAREVSFQNLRKMEKVELSLTIS